MQLFGALGEAQRAAVAEEGARLLADMTSATSYDVRFGEFVSQSQSQSFRGPDPEPGQG
ncbi:hypothetical protein [Streptomyces sp. NPDC001415]